MTSIQQHSYEINGNIGKSSPEVSAIKDSITFIRDNSALQLETLQGIRSNTEPLNEMKQQIGHMRVAIETIRDKGLIIKA